MENLQNETVMNEEVITEVQTETVSESQEELTLEQRIEATEKRLQEMMKRNDEGLTKGEELLAIATKNAKDAERLNMSMQLRSNGLDVFDGLFQLDTNEEKVEFLKNAVNQILVKNSYVPKDVAKQEQYTQAIESGDVQKALGFKFSNLFKKGN